MYDETGLRIALILAFMVLIGVIGIIVISIRYFLLDKKEGSLWYRLLPFLCYGIYPFIINPLLNIEGSRALQPIVSKSAQLSIHGIVVVFGLIAIIAYKFIRR